jgi:hypothetical protein
MLQTIKEILRTARRLFVVHNVPENMTDNETLRYNKSRFFFNSYSEDDPPTLSEVLVSLPRSVQGSDKIVPRLGHHRFR